MLLLTNMIPTANINDLMTSSHKSNSGVSDFVKTLAKYAIEKGALGPIGNIPQPVKDVANATIETGKAWGDIPGQIINKLQGKAPLPERQMSPSAQSGLEAIGSGFAVPSMEGATEGAAYLGNKGKEAVQGIKQGMDEAMNVAKAQPGGLQSGFVDFIVWFHTKHTPELHSCLI